MRSPVALILAGRSARAWDEGGRCGGWQLCAFGERCCHLRFSSRCGDVRWPCRFRRSAYSERYSCASWLRSCCSGRHRGNRCAPWWVADYGTLIRFDGCCGRFGCRGGRGDFVTLRYKIPRPPLHHSGQHVRRYAQKRSIPFAPHGRQIRNLDLKLRIMPVVHTLKGVGLSRR